MSLLLRGARVVCPATGRDEVTSVLLEEGCIAGFGDAEAERVLEVGGLVVSAGFVDMHVHLGEPGYEHKETLESGLRAAARGGFTTVCTSPATEPVNDQRPLTEFLVRKANALGGTRIRPIAAITKERQGKRLTEMYDLREAGAVAFGEGDRAVADAGLLRRAMEYAKAVGRPVFAYAEDAGLAAAGVMHEGVVSTRLGLKGVPAAAEEIAVARAIALARLTGARVHIGPLSAAASVESVRRAKSEGVPVSAAVNASHLHLCDEALLKDPYATDLRLRPPLRSAADLEALRAGVADGTIDAISSGHMPQSEVEKALEFDLAEPGNIGLQTALGLGVRLVDEGVLGLPELIARLTCGPAAALGLDVGRLEVGAPADLAVFDPSAKVRVEAGWLASSSRNTPFLGQALPGRIAWTIVGGRVAYSAEAPGGVS